MGFGLWLWSDRHFSIHSSTSKIQENSKVKSTNVEYCSTCEKPFGECELENTERLEQLRWLWMGKQIKVLRDDSCLGLGVDTIEDLQKVLLHLQKMK